MTTPTTLILGASAGIGRELALILAKAGHRLALVGRRSRESLDPSLAEVGSYFPFDLANLAHIQAIPETLRESGFEIFDTIVFNAAAGWYGDFADQSSECLRELSVTNLWAPIALTHSLHGQMKTPGCVLAYVSSIAAFFPSPKFAAYAACKAGLEAFARNLRIETAGQSRVLVARLGATRTELHGRSGFTPSERQLRRFADSQVVAKKIANWLHTASVNDATFGVGNRALTWLGEKFADPLDRLQRWRACRS